jgi:hypothetical protein
MKNFIPLGSSGRLGKVIDPCGVLDQLDPDDPLRQGETAHISGLAPAPTSCPAGEKRARKAWKRYCSDRGLIYEEPGLAEVEPYMGGYKITLSNVRGKLAEYSFCRWRLQRLWPELGA